METDTITPRPEQVDGEAVIVTDDGRVSVPQVLERDSVQLAHPNSEADVPESWEVDAVVRLEGAVHAISLSGMTPVQATWDPNSGPFDNPVEGQERWRASLLTAETDEEVVGWRETVDLADHVVHLTDEFRPETMTDDVEPRERCPTCDSPVDTVGKDPLEEVGIEADCGYYRAEFPTGIRTENCERPPPERKQVSETVEITREQGAK